MSLSFVERWWLRGGLFLLPLTYLPLTYDSYVLPKLVLARLLVLGLAAMLLLRAARDGRIELRRTPIDLPLALFLVSAAISTATAYNVNTAIFGTYSRYDGLLTTLTYAALFWLGVQAIRSEEEARALARTAIASGYVVAVVAAVQAIHDSAATGIVTAAMGSLGNQNVTGAFLAMVVPLAFFELVESRSVRARVVLGGVLLMLLACLVLTLSRSAWLGVGVAAAVLALAARGRLHRFGLAGLLAAGAVVVVLAGLAAGGLNVEKYAELRLISAVQPNNWGPRPHIWRDSLDVIASRPVLGYGPDNFGLVYPRYQTGEWAVDSKGVELQIDKAHAEVLQVAATQGLVGLATYLFLLSAFVFAFVRGERTALGAAFLAAWAGYETTVQLNFTALPAAFPFWIIAAAAVVTWDRSPRTWTVAAPLRPVLAVVLGSLGILATAGVAAPLAADAALRRAVDEDFAGQPAQAASDAATALALVPYESVYAVEVGNVAFEQGQWKAARSGYGTAVDLGTFNPRAVRNLALADRNLGLIHEALAAARLAEQLDRFDPANQALVNQLEAQNP